LKADIEAANERLAELTQTQERLLRRSISEPRTVPRVSPVGLRVSQSASVQDNRTSLSVEERAGLLVPGNVTGVQGPWIAYTTGPGGGPPGGYTNLVRIEGTSSLHNWRVESPLIAGAAEFAPGFLTQPGSEAQAGLIDCKASISIPVRTLKSVEPDGRRYSDRMDEAMYSGLRASSYQRIGYTLKTLTLRDDSPKAGPPYICDATGDLGIAGRTNTMNMVVAISPAANGGIQFSGTAKVKLRDFKVSVPDFAAGIGPIRLGDEVTVSFLWWAGRAVRLEAAR
jgi:hypothetical protein